MRAQHTAHQLPSFPIYSSAFLSPNELVLGGGGGASRSGIKNKLRLYRVSEKRELNLFHELELAPDEDAPMSMDSHLETKQIFCGINSSTEELTKGENQNCRIYGVKDDKFSLMGARGTLLSKDAEDYQKVTTLSPDGTLLLAAGAKEFCLLKLPGLAPVMSRIQIEKGEIYDATFSASILVVATTVNLLVYALPRAMPAKKKGKRKAPSLSHLELLHTVEMPDFPSASEGRTFRAARFHPQDPHILYTIVNSNGPRGRSVKKAPRPSFLCMWDTEKWEVTKVRKVGDKGVTCFDVSPSGKFLAFGCSDYQIALVDAKSLSPLLSILKAHDFPPTTLRFNPTSSLLVSGSADNSVRIVSIPSDLRGASWSTVIMIVIALLVVLLAVLLQTRLRDGLKW